MNELVKLAIDTYKGNLETKFSKNDSLEVLRKAFVDMNGGSTKLNFKKMRYLNSRPEMFAILEEILDKTVVEGLQENNFFTQFVDYRNLALGDENSFYIEDDSLFEVAEVAEGIGKIRRQRLNVGESVSVKTTLKMIAIYAELNMLLSGRIDFNDWINRVSKSFTNKVNNDIFTTFASAINELPAAFTETGAFDEDELIDIIQHVQAVTGNNVMLAGTMKSLRKLESDVVSESSKETYNQNGYYKIWNGVPAMIIPQVHKVGTFDFLLPDNMIYVISSDTKPIKYVTEGESLILMGEPGLKADLTQEYKFGDRYGMNVVMGTYFGTYEIA